MAPRDCELDWGVALLSNYLDASVALTVASELFNVWNPSYLQSWPQTVDVSCITQPPPAGTEPAPYTLGNALMFMYKTYYVGVKNYITHSIF